VRRHALRWGGPGPCKPKSSAKDRCKNKVRAWGAILTLRNHDCCLWQRLALHGSATSSARSGQRRASVWSAWSLLRLLYAPANPKAPASSERFRGKLDALQTLRASWRRQPAPRLDQAAPADKKIGINLCGSPKGILRPLNTPNTRKCGSAGGQGPPWSRRAGRMIARCVPGLRPSRRTAHSE
jgi:hypothetical protein